MELDPSVWGPHYWFVLNTIVLHYPKSPNKSIKKKYYNLIQNVPLFLPNMNIKKKTKYYITTNCCTCTCI